VATMANTRPTEPGGARDKGLRAGTLGLISSTVIGIASTAPAYSLAATLGFIVAAVGLQTPVVVIIAFVPILFVAIGYAELNRSMPDCGTTFTWATRAFGPRTGWMGGWGIIAADLLVMASLAQVAGQYVFLLFNADGIGHNPTSGWVLLVGILWTVAMTYICYRGIELSARFQQVLLSIELVMLAVFAVWALVRVASGDAPAGHLSPSLSWFNPFSIGSFSTFVNGVLLMLFIYWGWDSAVAVNEETTDRTRTPGRAAVISTVVLLATYVLVTLAAQSFAGIGQTGIGLGNADNQGDVLSVLGDAVFGTTGLGKVMAHLLILMVLSSAAASTQTTILPTARTTLSMAAHRALPHSFVKVHPRYLTPTVSTVAMGGASVVLYVLMNYLSGGNVIADAVSAIGLWIAFYYGLTGFACAWYYRRTLRRSSRELWRQGVLPTLGGLMLFFALVWSVKEDWKVDTGYTSWLLPFPPHWHIGGIFIIGALSLLVGLVLLAIFSVSLPAFFRGDVLSKESSLVVRADGSTTSTADELAGRVATDRSPARQGPPTARSR
jgi:amino acid transporter